MVLLGSGRKSAPGLQPLICWLHSIQHVHCLEGVRDATEMHLYSVRHAQHWHCILCTPCMPRKAEKQKHPPLYCPLYNQALC